MFVYRTESSIIPSIPVPIENKQLPPPSNVMAFGVPVFEAHKGMLCVCSYMTTVDRETCVVKKFCICGACTPHEICHIQKYFVPKL